MDAPLDDANVERLCDLLDAMVQDGATHFLIITHHGLTVAWMHRLYGVRIQEWGGGCRACSVFIWARRWRW